MTYMIYGYVTPIFQDKVWADRNLKHFSVHPESFPEIYESFSEIYLWKILCTCKLLQTHWNIAHVYFKCLQHKIFLNTDASDQKSPTGLASIRLLLQCITTNLISNARIVYFRVVFFSDKPKWLDILSKICAVCLSFFEVVYLSSFMKRWWKWMINWLYNQINCMYLCKFFSIRGLKHFHIMNYISKSVFMLTTFAWCTNYHRSVILSRLKGDTSWNT